MIRLGALLCAVASLAVAGPAVKARVHRESSAWRPVQVRVGAGAAPKRCFATWNGGASPCRAFARRYPVKEDTLLVVSVFPQALEARRTHLELRFLLVEGFLEELTVASVTAGPLAGLYDDVHALKQSAVSYQEELPVAGKLSLAALDSAKGGLTAGVLKGAAFSRPGLGRISVDFAARLPRN